MPRAGTSCSLFLLVSLDFFWFPLASLFGFPWLGFPSLMKGFPWWLARIFFGDSPKWWYSYGFLFEAKGRTDKDTQMGPLQPASNKPSLSCRARASQIQGRADQPPFEGMPKNAKNSLFKACLNHGFCEQQPAPCSVNLQMGVPFF